MRRGTIAPALLLLGALSLFSCGPGPGEAECGGVFWRPDRAPYLAANRAVERRSHVTWATGNHTAAPVPVGSAGPARYTSRLSGMMENAEIGIVMRDALRDGVTVILVIGDGFGPTHLALADLARAAAGEGAPSAFRQVMRSGGGFALTWASDALVTDSAAAATALACGVKTARGRLGIDPAGKTLASILEKARSAGMAAGIVTDTRVTHATPAAFYAHAPERGDEAGIALQLLEGPGVDVILGGGASLFVSANSSTGACPLLKTMRPGAMSRRRDNRDLVSDFSRRGYRIVCDRKGLLAAGGYTGRILGLFAAEHMNSAIDRDDEDTGEPSVVEMTGAALTALSGNRKGFFLMVECGRIDYDAHSNDMGALLRGVLEMDRVVAACDRYQKRHRDRVLLVFTGDHETGGPAFSYYAPRHGGRKHSSSPAVSVITQFLKQKRSMRSIFASPASAGDLLRQFNSAMPFPVAPEDAERIYDLIGSSPQYR